MNNKRFFLRSFAPVVMLLLAALSVRLFWFVNGLSLQQLKAAAVGFGAMASAAFLIICVLRGLVFFPCGLISTLGGMVFGPWIGTAFSLVGLTAGSVLTFYLARRFGKGWVQHILGSRYDKYEGHISRHSFYSIFLMRAVPVLPFDVVSCIAGMSGARVDKYILATFTGSLPGVLIYVLFGDSIRSMSIRRVIFSAALTAFFAVLPFFYRKLAILIQKIV